MKLSTAKNFEGIYIAEDAKVPQEVRDFIEEKINSDASNGKSRR